MLRVKGKFAKKTQFDRYKFMTGNNNPVLSKHKNPVLEHSYFLTENVNNNNKTKVSGDEHRYNSNDKFTEEISIGASVEVDSTNTINDEWTVGRRVVELGHMAKSMVCVMCRSRLHLLDTVEEKRMGLGSILRIKCPNSVCNAICSVETGKRNNSGAFDINTKAALGMVHSGLGASDVNSFLTTCNIPPINPVTLRKKEKIVGKAMLKEAEDSCQKSIEEEKKLAGEKLDLSFDAGWQKRGTGMNYNSNTGHGTFIGSKTGRVLNFSLRSKTCKTCSHYETRNETVPSHECSRNWSGTSKGMECDMALSMAHEMHDKGAKISVLNADSDSTTTARMKIDFPNLQKKEDKNHLKKGLSKKLYALSKKHKELKFCGTIPYLLRCFTDALYGKNDAASIERSIGAIVPHTFGDHKGCDESWCKYKQNPRTFRYRSLPDGQPFQSKSLQDDLNNIFISYQKRSENLVQLGSTQANENFNHIMASKAPKGRNYGSSGSLKGRLSSAVLQKNEGHGYISKVNETCMLSPGHFTMGYGKKIDKIRETEKQKRNTREFKRKRMLKKMKRNKVESISEVKEGLCYSSNIDMETLHEDSVTEIPSPIPIADSDTFIVFDLETTGLGRQADIIQISAKACTGQDTCFSRYVIPRKEITIKASQVTGISYQRSCNKMFVHGREVQAVPLQVALVEFLEFLQSQQRKVLLVGHNISAFDIPILLNRMNEFQMCGEICKTVKGYIDTLKLSKRVFSKEEVGNYKQETLVKKFLGVDTLLMMLWKT